MIIVAVALAAIVVMLVVGLAVIVAALKTMGD